MQIDDPLGELGLEISIADAAHTVLTVQAASNTFIGFPHSLLEFTDKPVEGRLRQIQNSRGHLLAKNIGLAHISRQHQLHDLGFGLLGFRFLGVSARRDHYH